MSEFTDILMHVRRLQGAVKSISINDLESVASKLQRVIARRKEQLLALEKAEIEKRKAAEEIKLKMQESGIDIADLEALSEPNKPGQDREHYLIKFSC